jgi:abortive infection bacteriophage resistance protein
MANKTPSSIADQIALLKQRGLLFNDEQSAHHFLENINYYFSRHIAKPILL